MNLDQIVRKSGAWLGSKQATEIVISSRVRLARNVKGERFPGWAGEDRRVRLAGKLRAALEAAPSLREAVYLDMGALSATEKDILTERHLISHELAERGPGSGVAVTADEQIAVMVNEEDHLRLQALMPGLDLMTAWMRIDQVDTELEELLDYAFSPRLGYITACPTNLGTGLRASVMLHLSGLKLMDEIEAVINGLERIGLTVRGLTGEGTEAHGNMYQVSNQMTIGETEVALVNRLFQTIGELETHERNARLRLLESRRTYLLDQIGRALGVLLHARILSSSEAIERLSALRLGVELGLVGHVDLDCLNELMILTQPGHLQKIAHEELTPEERDELRAKVIGERLRNARFTE